MEGFPHAWNRIELPEDPVPAGVFRLSRRKTLNCGDLVGQLAATTNVTPWESSRRRPVVRGQHQRHAQPTTSNGTQEFQLISTEYETRRGAGGDLDRASQPGPHGQLEC